MVEVVTDYKHIVLNEAQEPVIAGTTLRVVELVLEQKAYGWNAEELQHHNPALSLGQVYSALAYYQDHQGAFDRYIEQLLQAPPEDWIHEGTDDAIGDRQAFNEALALLQQYETNPSEWITLEDLKAELAE